MRSILRAAFLAFAMVSFAPLLAEAASVQNVVVSTAEDGAPTQGSFALDTPEIFMRADLVDVAPGSIVTVTWLALDTGPNNPPNFRIDQVALRVGEVGRRVRASLPRPGAAWQAGTYRVRLSLNGQTLQRIDFTIG
ncbi:hypothetical protein GCM10011390_14920 [Aureimonas endophytica]|uniref:Uncharacterized protein n=1 Tax=Aureimonas endophytica TaxID=2027858 RepID=A0A916ZHN9_9HYPH|nr:hypothetical protein [Aureimonas endophytica]GGD97189.1 hypothetical protein GCM10011390_14920 [Aureimonas endophytica]